MGLTLVIAEKPSVGREFAKVLNCRQKKEEYYYGNDYIVTWCFGHLVTLKDAEEYNPAWKRWSVKALPIIPENLQLKAIRKSQKQFYLLKKLMNLDKVTSLICATDAGREGELIFRYVYQLTGCRKPFKRLWISSLTEEAIKEGFRNLKPGADFDNLYHSARCRAEADWLVGINATRAYTVQQGALLSVGRVQTPTLAMLVARQKELNSFKPEKYWEISVQYREGFSGLWYDLGEKQTRLFDKNRAEAIVKKVNGSNGVVMDVKREEKREMPPLLHDLTELQREANKVYGFSAKKTLDIAQALYEGKKAITYPRTDSRYLSEDMVKGLRNLVQKLNTGKYVEIASYVANLSRLPVTKRIVNNSKVSDHHAIIPTGRMPSKLSADEQKLFDLVVRRFLGAFYPAYSYAATTALVLAAEEYFVSKGKEVKVFGWKVLYNSKKSNQDEQQEKMLPSLAKKQPVQIQQVELEDKKTSPPKPYTEGTLLSAMEHAGKQLESEELKEHMKEGGLGTPATRASIIERLLKVGYVERKKKTLVPTEKGMNLIQIAPEQLKSPELTGKWEKALNLIAKGQVNPIDFKQGIIDYTCQVVKLAASTERQQSFRQEKTSLGKCPICKEGDITANKKGYGCSRWKQNCKFFIGAIAKKKLTENQIKKLITTGRTGQIKGFTSKKGTKFQAALELSKDGKVEFVFENK